MQSSWRNKAAPIIAKLIAELGTQDMPKLRVALSQAYPFGLKRYHPYKIWLDEIRDQLGTKRAQQKSQNEQRQAEQDQQSGQQRLFQ